MIYDDDPEAGYRVTGRNRGSDGNQGPRQAMTTGTGRNYEVQLM
jgi:hypothetical protein